MESPAQPADPVPFYQQRCFVMIEIAPYLTHIEELRQRTDSLRGYL